MRIFELSAFAVLLLFLVGEFLAPGRFGKKPSYRSTVWKINVALIAAWGTGCILLFAGLGIGRTLLLLISVIWIIGHIRTHWVPYFFGAPEEYRVEYKRVFKDSFTVLPRITSRGIVPDLYHTLLFISLLILVFTGIRGM
jgi:Na+-transporting methylmalonyl-CoA/oxaloacetate decarboxylase gamma subunit